MSKDYHFEFVRDYIDNAIASGSKKSRAELIAEAEKANQDMSSDNFSSKAGLVSWDDPDETPPNYVSGELKMDALKRALKSKGLTSDGPASLDELSGMAHIQGLGTPKPTLREYNRALDSEVGDNLSPEDNARWNSMRSSQVKKEEPFGQRPKFLNDMEYNKAVEANYQRWLKENPGQVEGKASWGNFIDKDSGKYAKPVQGTRSYGDFDGDTAAIPSASLKNVEDWRNSLGEMETVPGKLGALATASSLIDPLTTYPALAAMGYMAARDRAKQQGQFAEDSNFNVSLPGSSVNKAKGKTAEDIIQGTQGLSDEQKKQMLLKRQIGLRVPNFPMSYAQQDPSTLPKYNTAQF